MGKCINYFLRFWVQPHIIVILYIITLRLYYYVSAKQFWGLSWWLRGQRIHLQCGRYRSCGFDPLIGKITCRRKWLLLLLLSCVSRVRHCCPIDGGPPGSPVSGILQARTLEWVAISFSKAWKWKVKGKSLSHVWFSDPMDCSVPGSSVHGIWQARVLEWGAIAFSGRKWQPAPIFCPEKSHG